MIRGTTPTLRFVIPFDTSELSCVNVAISQAKKLVLEKEINSCELEGNIILCPLTQEDTLLLRCNVLTEVQLRIKKTNGQALASEIYETSVERILKDGVI